MLTQLNFENFRGFKFLNLEGLQRVNLIVGKNNSGKTSLLEGITILLNPTTAGSDVHRYRSLEHDLEYRFNGGTYSRWLMKEGAQHDMAVLSGNWFGPGSKRHVGDKLGVNLKVASKQDSEILASELFLDNKPLSTPKETSRYPAINIAIVSSNARAPMELAESLAQAVVRKGGEEFIEKSLQKVDGRIRKIRTVAMQHQKEIKVIVEMELQNLVPLSQLGQGIYRLVEIFSEVIGTSASVVFIDEIENGIHHTCLIDLWKGIAEAARSANIQVFATTHSYECVQAAHEAFCESPSYDFSVIQLFREYLKDQQGRVLDRRLIEAAIAGEIDLRG